MRSIIFFSAFKESRPLDVFNQFNDENENNNIISIMNNS